jgi:hypothetical protein
MTIRTIRWTQARLRHADLMYTQLNGANASGADLSGANVYGVSAWNVVVNEDTIQSNLRIENYNEPSLTVDNLQVAQFIHLLVHNDKIRDVINTVTSKVVLILGRFTLERKQILDAIRNALRNHNYVPVLFDFEQAEDRNITETVTLLARMARFVIADITDPRSIPQELQAITPHVRVPIRSIIQRDQEPYSMYRDLLAFPWIIRPLYRYQNKDHLLAELSKEIIDVAEAKHRNLAQSQGEETF